MYSVQKKVPEYRYPLYRSTGIGLKKLFLSIVFHYTQEKLFLKHTTRASPARVTDKKNPPALEGYYFYEPIGKLCDFPDWYPFPSVPNKTRTAIEIKMVQ